TPTRVGTTDRKGPPWSDSPVHPHARGDDEPGVIPAWTGIGTPPRAWGRPAAGPTAPGLRRYTPTRVGTTSGPGMAEAACAVHPHARGDDGDAVTEFPLRSGTPPRAWGRRFHRHACALRKRYTPTRVGTTRPHY